MTAVETEPAHRPSLKERAIEEFKVYWIIVFYLGIFLGALTNYRRLILAEFGVSYVNYGVAVIEALIIAKVILVAKAFRFSRWLENRPLLYPVIFKAVLFGVLVFLFGIVERVVEAWFHKEGVATAIQKIGAIGLYELSARALMLILAFVPFFAFWEVGRIVGFRRLAAMFFTKPNACSE
jgi:hypothetical protein